MIHKPLGGFEHLFEEILILHKKIEETQEQIYGISGYINAGGAPISTDVPEVPDKEWSGTPDNPYTPDLGSDELHALHAEFDQRILDLQKELDYEEQQKAYVAEASEGIVFSEDADHLARQLAQRVKIEIAE